jgi:hypothetical protein
MAMLVLEKMWVTLASTGQMMAGATIGDESEVALTGEVRQFAGGRFRYVGRTGVGGQLDRTFRALPKRIAELLEEWIGQTVFVRDHRGQAWWGVFKSVKRRNIKGALGLYDVSVTIELVSQDEGV